jgi:hypothetical protein
VVDFQQIRLQLVVEQNVQAKNLKTHCIRVIIGLARVIGVGQRRLYRAKGFNDHIIDLLLDVVYVVAIFG